jgi:tetratricopeptide (TPR) repeat protein
MLNVPLLAGTLIAIVVLGPTAYCWHSYQLGRTAEALLQEADRLEEGEEFAKAATCLRRYLQLHPDNVDVRVRLAKTFDKSAKDPSRKAQAIELHYRALGLGHDVIDDATRRDLRCRLAELLLELAPYPPPGRHALAEAEAEKLLEANDEDPQARRLLALALYGQLQSGALAGEQAAVTRAVMAFENALFLQANRGDLALSETLSRIYRHDKQLPDDERSARVYRDDQQLSDNELSAILTKVCQAEKESLGDGLSGIRRRMSRADKKPIEPELERVALRVLGQEAGGSKPDYSSLLAAVCEDANKVSREDRRTVLNAVRRLLATDVIDQVVAANPKAPEAFLARYRYRVQYRLAGAKDDLKSALEHGPDNLAVLLAVAGQDRRNADDAERARREAADAQQAEVLAGEIGKYLDEARKHYEHAIEIAPQNEMAYLGLGDIHQAQGALYQAEGARHQAQGNSEEAQAEFERAQRSVDRAIEVWQQGLEMGDEENIGLNTCLADVLIALGRLEQFYPRDKDGKENPKNPLSVLDRTIAKRAPTLRRAVRIPLEQSNVLLRARWLVRKRDYSQAIPLLRRVALGQTNSASEVTQAFQAWMLLGSAYALVARGDQAATAYEEAARLQPKTPQPRLAAAGAWATAGRWEAAIRHYEHALSLGDTERALSPQATAATWFLLAQVHLRRQVSLTKEERDWGRFDTVLAEAKDPNRQVHLASAWRLKVLEADYAVVRAAEQGQRDEGLREAAKLLRQAESEYSDSDNLLQRLVLAYEQLGCPADADRALEKFDKLAGTSANAYVLRSGLYSRRKQYEQARKVLQAGLTALPSQMRPALHYALAKVSLDEGKSDQARRELSKLHDKAPANIALIRQLAELAFQAGKLEELQRWEEKLRKIEGPNGSWWPYYRARRLLAQAKDTNDPRFIEAAELHAQIQGQRPAWPAAHLLGGRIWQSRGNPDRAIKAYQEAIHLGDQRISVYERLIALLYATQQFAEADQYLARLQDHVPTSQSLSSLEISAAARLGQLDRAVEAARRGVARRPKDPMARVWLGHMLLATDQADEAESAFQEAVKLAPADARTYSGLFSFYLNSEQPDRAKEALQELAQKVDLSEAQRAFVLAQGYELLGDQKEAEASYREAQRLAPESVGVQRRLAAFLMRTDTMAAEKAIRRLLQLSPQSGPARRTLAAILAARGGEKEWQEAQELLEQSGSADVSSLDQHLQAMLLARRGGKDNLRKARQLLERLIADSRKVEPGHRLLLARLYEAEGRLFSARQQYIALVGRAEPSVGHLALYIDLLLRHDLLDEAVAWLHRLEEIAPDSLATVSLRTRWLHGQGRTSEIEPLVEQLADKLLKALEKAEQQDSQKEAQICLAVGNVYSAVEQHQAAERWYRRLAELVPERYEALAISLARQERLSEAIGLCLQAAKSDSSPRPAAVLAAVLMSGKPTEEDFRLAGPLLAKAVEDHKDNAGLLSSLANVRIIEQRTDDAVQLYRQVLKLKPKDILALNNLATLLSEQSDTRKEALQYIEQAIQIAGPQAPLLDTKGTIFVYGGRADEAVQSLEAAVTAANPDPRYHFHLAIAYHQLGEIEKARDAFNTARDGNLTDQILTKTDQKFLTRLEQELGQ